MRELKNEHANRRHEEIASFRASQRQAADLTVAQLSF